MNLHRLLQHGDLLLDSSILGLQPLDQSQVSIEVKWTNERTALPDLDHHQISEREVEVLLAVVGLAPPVARLGDPLGRVVQLLLQQYILSRDVQRVTELTDLNVEDLVALVNGLVELLEPEFDCGDVEDTRHLHRPHPAHQLLTIALETRQQLTASPPRPRCCPRCRAAG